MAAISILLDDWEHMCCGKRRAVGDAVTMRVQNIEGTIYERRHGDIDDYESDTQPMTGTITAIRFRPAIMVKEYNGRKLVGYEPGFSVESTDYDPVEMDWAFEFSVDTDDPIPPPREPEQNGSPSQF